MIKRRISDGLNPAQVRGDIQAGLTGDKRPGFDPALAPLETDAEAAGTPLDSEMIETARETQLEGKHADVSADEGSAMRPVFPANHPPRTKIPLVGISVAFAAAVVLFGVLAFAFGWL